MDKLNIKEIKILSLIYTNKYIKISLLIISGLYFVISPKLSNNVLLLYNNMVFRALILLLIIYLSIYDNQLALMVVVVYLITANNLNKINLDIDSDSDIDNDNTL